MSNNPFLWVQCERNSDQMKCMDWIQGYKYMTGAAKVKCMLEDWFENGMVDDIETLFDNINETLGRGNKLHNGCSRINGDVSTIAHVGRFRVYVNGSLMPVHTSEHEIDTHPEMFDDYEKTFKAVEAITFWSMS